MLARSAPTTSASRVRDTLERKLVNFVILEAAHRSDVCGEVGSRNYGGNVRQMQIVIHLFSELESGLWGVKLNIINDGASPGCPRLGDYSCVAAGSGEPKRVYMR